MTGKEIIRNIACLKRALHPHVEDEKLVAQIAFDLAELYSELEKVENSISKMIESETVSKKELLKLAQITGGHWHDHLKSLRAKMRKGELLFP